MAVWERKDGYHVKIAPKGMVIITVRKPEGRFSFLTIFEEKVTESTSFHNEQAAMDAADTFYDPPVIPSKVGPNWSIWLSRGGKKFSTVCERSGIWWVSDGFSLRNRPSREEAEEHAKELIKE